MSNILTIGTFHCQPDMARFEIKRQGILSGTNRIHRVRNTWVINGRVRSEPGASGSVASAQVDLLVVQLEAALHDGIDLSFSLGSTMYLTSAAMAEGTHIRRFVWTTGIDHVNGSGAEGLLRRTFELEVYGDNLLNQDTLITGWRDSIRSFGTGGAKVVPVGSLNGAVQAQQLQAITPYRCIQSGFGIGLRDYPLAPVPNFLGNPGVYYDPDTLNTERFGPERWGRNTNTNFGVRWNYMCWGTIPLLSNPQTF
jgi:hypothetical protein